MAFQNKKHIMAWSNTAKATALYSARKAIASARAESPKQRGWICHSSHYYNPPDTTT
jgi:hypothetical protein